jgi:hypothetical protein
MTRISTTFTVSSMLAALALSANGAIAAVKVPITPKPQVHINSLSARGNGIDKASPLSFDKGAGTGTNLQTAHGGAPGGTSAQTGQASGKRQHLPTVQGREQ